MVTILFRCPKCEIHCIRRIICREEAFAIANLLPVLASCWNCQTESLVVLKDRALPPEGVWDNLLGHCLRIADACDRRASEAESFYIRDIYRRMQQHWLHIGSRTDKDQVAALIGASITRRAAAVPPRLIA